MMKNAVCVQTGNWYDSMFGGERVDEAFAFIKSCGFDAVDFNIDHTIPTPVINRGKLTDFYDAPLAEILDRFRPMREASKRHGVAIAMAHAPFPMYLPGREDMAEYLLMAVEKILAVLDFLDCPALVVHPLVHDDKEWEWEHNLQMYRRLIPAARLTGVKVCLENLFVTRDGRALPRACADAEEACRYIDLLNAEAGRDVFGFCFDVGHANITGRDIAQDVRTLGRRLTVLHIHDNNGVRDQHMLPYTQKSPDGTPTNFGGFLQALSDIGYEGPLNFETFAALDMVPAPLQPATLRYIAAIGAYFRDRLCAK